MNTNLDETINSNIELNDGDRKLINQGKLNSAVVI